MSKNRRTFLKAAGGAGLMLVGAGALFTTTRRPSGALDAWDAAKASSSDARLDVFRHAILAPNPHNRQPWQIQLVGRDQAVIICDLDRRLPETDPFDRQITIGFGCFLELARMAAAERGLRMDTTLFPQGEPVPRLTSAPIAHLRFVPDPGVAKDPLFGAILIRRSSKVPFASQRAVDARTFDALTRAVGDGTAAFASSDPALVADLRALTWRAWMIEATTRRTWQESVDLMRIGRSEIEANPDGIALGGAVLGGIGLGRSNLEEVAGRPQQPCLQERRGQVPGDARTDAVLLVGHDPRERSTRPDCRGSRLRASEPDCSRLGSRHASRQSSCAGVP